jgi:tetratricopeptide (TPR) repeat protein
VQSERFVEADNGRQFSKSVDGSGGSLLISVGSGMKIEVTKGVGPGAWLRNRRLAEFSDSTAATQPALDRATLEYQLDTLGNRSQESDFEKFAHALASAELCPNLLPQTGPTGGGDSKVDAETYPVADDLTLNWFIGEPEKASSERWAFAFSTMEDWATKVRQDVAKIAGVGRGYKRAYYISSRFIRDKRRGEVEDELTKEYGIDVRILDRNWIVERVYAGRHEVMAAEKLGLSVPELATRRIGPLDQTREDALAHVEREIDELKQKLSDPYSGTRFVAALLEIATLTRSLEHPPEKVEGRFAAARRAAEKYGTTQQTIEAAYEWARTTFWWLEDREAFEEAFKDVEQLVGDVDDVYLLGLRCTLLLLRSVASMGDDAASAENSERRERLAKQFDLLSAKDDAPNAAAVARMRAACLRMFGANPDRTAELLVELRAVADAGHDLIGFPLAELVYLVSEYGKYGSDLPEFDAVLEHVTQLLADQKGNVHAAEALVRRGREHLLAKRPYRAISTIGKALMRLVSRQGRETFAHALFLLGTAYEDVGLLWAARAAFVHAAAVSLEDFYEDNEANENQVTCMKCVRQIEVRLGRVAHALAWHSSARHFMGIVDGRAESPERLGDEIHFNALLTILLLRTPHTELRRLSGLAGRLDKLGLPVADAAVLFALGHEREARKELDDMKMTEPINEVFGMILRQPAASDIAAQPLWHDGSHRSFTSIVLGCEIHVVADGEPSLHEVAETFIAMVESLLATGMIGDHPIIALVPRVTVRLTEVNADDIDASRFLEADTPSAGELLNLNVRVARHDAASLTAEQRGGLQQQVIEVVIELVARAFSLGNDLEQLMERFGQERAHERTLGITSTAACLRRAIGSMPLTLDGWSDQSSCRLPLREQPWTPDTDKIISPISESRNDQDPALPKWETLRHTDIRSASLIHRDRWRAAGWWGFAYLNDLDNSYPPIICPCFSDREKGRHVISDIRDQLNTDKPEHDLKLAIIRGISSENPLDYRIVIGSWPRHPFAGQSPPKMFTTMSLGKDMTPTDHTNLNRFLTGYAKHNRARFLPMTGEQKHGLNGLERHLDLDIMIEGVEIIDAWRIDQKCFASCGIMPGDKPFIPPDRKTDAPVLKVLRERDAATRGTAH